MTISTTSPTASITAQLLKNGKEASIHPAIIKLGLAFAEYKIMGAAERCKQMLLAFKQVRKRERGIEEERLSILTFLFLSISIYICILISHYYILSYIHLGV